MGPETPPTFPPSMSRIPICNPFRKGELQQKPRPLRLSSTEPLFCFGERDRPRSPKTEFAEPVGNHSVKAILAAWQILPHAKTSNDASFSLKKPYFSSKSIGSQFHASLRRDSLPRIRAFPPVFFGVARRHKRKLRLRFSILVYGGDHFFSTANTSNTGSPNRVQS
jgi:hypothetical protein